MLLMKCMNPVQDLVVMIDLMAIAAVEEVIVEYKTKGKPSEVETILKKVTAVHLKSKQTLHVRESVDQVCGAMMNAIRNHNVSSSLLVPK